MLAKTVSAMTMIERSLMVARVSDALDSLAEAAVERGERYPAQNAWCLAATLRGCSTKAGRDVRAVEVLLEQAMSLIASEEACCELRSAVPKKAMH